MSLLTKLFKNNTEEENNMGQDLNIGIILGSTREGRVSPQVGEWVKGIADQRNDANYEIVDIKDYELPLLGEGDAPGIVKWNEKLDSLDGFIFIVQEYNHSLSASLKNALDLAREPWNNKAAGIVSYGSTGGARAAEHLRGILGELMVADVRAHPTLSLFTDFVDGTTFKPQDLHLDNVNMLLDQVNSWSGALKSVRKSEVTV
ncbi:NADPH-dependent FMN reductase [Piscibacillus sp. B03]|uniref:NADPH-dependent FMN reductase n=1 Tax=Piscibacillus sp. B03 TaxID=3457430 RepID=UPI003FCEB284